MAAERHNLTRRAVLGAGAAAPLVHGVQIVHAMNAAPPAAYAAARTSWVRALAGYRRAEARVAAFKAQEARLPAELLAFPCEDLEEEFGRLDGLRLNALRRLLRLPAPDLPGLALKLELAVADLAWELDGCESCLAAAAADARRLAHGG